MLNRRSFLVGLAAPAIIPAINLMPVRLFVPPSTASVITTARLEGVVIETIICKEIDRQTIRTLENYLMSKYDMHPQLHIRHDLTDG